MPDHAEMGFLRGAAAIIRFGLHGQRFPLGWRGTGCGRHRQHRWIRVRGRWRRGRGVFARPHPYQRAGHHASKCPNVRDYGFATGALPQHETGETIGIAIGEGIDHGLLELAHIRRAQHRWWLRDARQPLANACTHSRRRHRWRRVEIRTRAIGENDTATRANATMDIALRPRHAER